MAIIEDAYGSQHTGGDAHAAALRGPRSEHPHLRRSLVAVDVLAVVIAWAAAFGLGADGGSTAGTTALGLVLVVLSALAALRQQRLYRARVATIRSEEVARLGRVACVSGLAALLVDGSLGLDIAPALLAGGAGGMFVLLVYGRGRSQRWIGARRADGQFARPVVVVGDSDDVIALVDLFDDSPELGLVPVGFAGALDLDAEVPNIPWLGGSDDALAAVTASGATGVVISSTSVAPGTLNRLVRELHGARIHVHLSSGITGVHHRRLRVQPVGYEPLIYVEPSSLSTAQLVAKRTIDVVGSAVGLVVASPVILAAAIAVRCGDGGPAFFRQERVGRDGRPFRIFKLRTMCVDAEERLAEVQARNERKGPLFKLADDPRVTRIGRFLRASSLDELPQLFNVLNGTMSLVGPRPALPAEVSRFDGRLTDRLLVRPGVTGLWQVEARDKASFSAYRRLDLYYVDNWSVWLDLAILLKTGRPVLRRVRSALRPTTSSPSSSEPTKLNPVLEAVE